MERPSEYLHTTFQSRLSFRDAAAGVVTPKDLITAEDRLEQYRRLEAMIGNTPTLGYEAKRHSFVLIKVESQNPTESHYDRVYIPTLKRLEELGIIKPGDDLYEVTSGSAGISFAWACSRLGYNANVFAPAKISQARKQEITNFGARLVQIPQGYVPEASKEEWKQFTGIAKTNRYKLAKHQTDDFSVITAEGDGKRMCLINHSENPLTPKSLESIGEEITSLIPVGVGIDYFVTVLGNGSNTMGVTEGLRERFIDRKLKRGWPTMQVVGVEDWDNPVQFEAKYPGLYQSRFGREPSYKTQRMFGSSARGTKLRFMDIDQIDEIRLVADREWEPRMQSENAACFTAETIGASTAASLVVAEQIAREHPGSIILTIAYDKGDRYGSPVDGNMGMVDGSMNLHLVSPNGWRQWLPESPIDLPVSLRQAYSNPQQVRAENLALATA